MSLEIRNYLLYTNVSGSEALQLVAFSYASWVKSDMTWTGVGIKTGHYSLSQLVADNSETTRINGIFLTPTDDYLIQDDLIISTSSIFVYVSSSEYNEMDDTDLFEITYAYEASGED